MPLLGPTVEGRNAVFQRLKPSCVALSQASLTLATSHPDTKTVTLRLEELHANLESVSGKNAGLDPKLADYVFFPVSQVLKASQKLSIQCLELSLACIAILISQGWQAEIEARLAAQVAILCTLMAERNPKGFSFAESTDELQCAALSCLQHLFTTVGGSRESRELLTSEANFPQLGQTISVILDDIQDSLSIEVQVAGTRALRQLFEHVTDREICASFLPGIVSKLTKILTLSTRQRRNHKVLIECLEILSRLLQDTLGNDREDGRSEKLSTTLAGKKQSIIDSKWKSDAATQMKPALRSIVRLKAHSREDVKESLAKLCLSLLEHCQTVLIASNELLLETLVSIVSSGHGNEDLHVNTEMLVRTDAAIAGVLQSILYDSIPSLTTIMQSSDDAAKVVKLEELKTMYTLLVDTETAGATIERMLASSLRDSVIVTLLGPGRTSEQVLTVDSPVQALELTVSDATANDVKFRQPLVKYRGQEEVMTTIEEFASMMRTTSATNGGFMTDLTRSLRQSQGEAQIANFWLLLVAAQNAQKSNSAVADFLNLDGQEQDAVYVDCLEEIYSFALNVLTDQTLEMPDPRLQALALRALALRAQTAGEDFRYDLVDALYPVLHTLATPEDILQRDSIVTLNIFTSVCGYVSVKDLIVDNVDYLTNAVALKLNAFDVSPQAPQVLLMMVRLAGPSLLPYLDDTVESIFAALEDFHGYPLLVELLFRVLGVVAEEGAKAPLLAIADGNARQRVDRIIEEVWVPTTMEDLTSLLTERKMQATGAQSNTPAGPEPHPARPWEKSKGVNEEEDDDDIDDEVSAEQDQQLDETHAPPPAPKTYNILLKITELTQHFLPSASPSLRASLLSLVRTTVPAIARHENSFLPLINTLWPEIVSRLDDAEPVHVKVTALELVGVLCEFAGGFMRTRIEALWPKLVEMYQNLTVELVGGAGATLKSFKGNKKSLDVSNPVVLEKAVARIQSSLADYHGDTSSRLLWTALINAFTTIVEKVDLPPETFDEALELLRPVLREDRVHAAFEVKNPDALWLADVQNGSLSLPDMPTVSEKMGWRLTAVF